MRICLYEDAQAAAFEPLSLTRPVFDLPCGVGTIASRQAAWAGFGVTEGGVFVRPEIEALFRESHPAVPVNDAAWLDAGPILLVNARWQPPVRPGFDTARPCLGIHRGAIAYAVLPCCALDEADIPHLEALLNRLRGALPECEVGGTWLESVADLASGSPKRIEEDCRRLTREPSVQPPAGLVLIGPNDRLRVDASATIHPQVLADTTLGPIVIQRNAVIDPFSKLVGPCVIGPRSHVRGGRVERAAIGADCLVAGEIEGSVIGSGSRVHAFATVLDCIAGSFTEIEPGSRACGLVAGDYSILAANSVIPAASILGVGASWHGSAVHSASLPLFHARQDDARMEIGAWKDCIAGIERRSAAAGRIIGAALKERLKELWERERRTGAFAAGEGPTPGLRVALAG